MHVLATIASYALSASPHRHRHLLPRDCAAADMRDRASRAVLARAMPEVARRPTGLACPRRRLEPLHNRCAAALMLLLDMSV